MTDRPFGVEELNIKGSGTATPVIEGSGNIAIKLGTATSKLYIGDPINIGTGDIANTSNTTVVNCGFLTANKIFGQVVGKSDGTGGSEAEKLYVSRLGSSSNVFYNILTTEAGSGSSQITNGYKSAYVDDEYLRCAWNPSVETLYAYRLRTRAIYTNGGSAGNTGQILVGAGPNGEFTWENQTGASSGTYGSATQVPEIVVDSVGRVTGITNKTISVISSVDVNQYSEGTTERSCSNPISVTGGDTIGIGSTSNAYGRKYVQTTEPSGDLCEGDIWYDTSDSGSGSNITIGAGSDLNKIITVNSKQLILESATGTVKVNGNLDANIPFDVDAETGTYTLVAADAGKFKTVTGDITIPDSVFGEGDSITIYNNTANQIDILPSSVTLRLAGSTITGARSLVGYGLATVICVQTTGTDEFVLVGAGLT